MLSKIHVSISGNAYNGSSALAVSDMTSDSAFNAQKPIKQWGEKTSYYLTLLKVNKQIYAPNSITVEIDVDNSSSTFPQIAVGTLLNGKISVWRMVDDTNGAKKEEIAIDYDIHEVKPVVYASSLQKHTKITIVAYSHDKMLTYEKYSMAYTGKRLYQDIISNTLSDTFKNAFEPGKYMDKPYFNNTVYREKEIIYPYLMQYNESFYNFVRRVAYRSGEYLYFDNGKLHLGIDVSPKDSDLQTIPYNSMQLMSQHLPGGGVSVGSVHHDYNQKGYNLSATGISYNEECSLEDYNIRVEASPNKTPFVEKPSLVPTLITTFLTGEGFLARRTAAMLLALGLGVYQTDNDNDEKNKKFNKSQMFTEDKGTLAERFDVNSDEATKYDPFLMFDSASMMLANAYKRIREGEENSRLQMTHLTLASTTKEVYLGQIIKLEDDSTKYVVVGVSHDEEIQKTYKPVLNDAKNAIEMQEVTDENDTETTYCIDVVPLYTYASKDPENKTIFPPLQNDIETVRKIGPQTAYVSNTDDPNKLGRLQVQFHWQTSKADATPYIRVSSSMASHGGGVMFTPNKYDEVIINFTNDNADLPYVAGYLYNGDNKAPKESRSIRSCNGHTISFDDSGDGDTDFLKSLLPFMKWIDNLQKDESDSQSNKISGFKNSVEENLKKFDSSITSTSDSNLYNYLKKYKQRDTIREFIKAASKISADTLFTTKEKDNLKYKVQYDKTELTKDKSIKNYLVDILGKDNIKKAKEKNVDTDDNLELLKTYMDSFKENTLDKLKNDTDKKKIAQAKYDTLNNFYTEATAINDDDVIKDATATIEDKQYDKQKANWNNTKDKSKYDLLPSDDEVAAIGKSGKLSQLSAWLDKLEKDNIESCFIMDDLSNASSDYTSLKSKFDDMKTAHDDAKTHKEELAKGVNAMHTGGITLTDDAGLYKLDLSATKRNITISCPLGDVKIDALTGITISAPNGDVTIEGKNINLKAGNNITVDAGSNRKKWDSSPLVKKTGTSLENATIDGICTLLPQAVKFIPNKIGGVDWAGKAKVGGVDMKAVRCVFECIFRPIEATLKIHSQANLMLEAGGASTNPNVTNLNSSYNRAQITHTSASRIARSVKFINDTFAKYIDVITAERKNISVSDAALNAKLTEFADNNAPALKKAVFDAIKGKIDSNSNTAAEILDKIKDNLKEPYKDDGSGFYALNDKAVMSYKYEDFSTQTKPWDDAIQEEAEAKKKKVKPGNFNQIQDDAQDATSKKNDLNSFISVANSYIAAKGHKTLYDFINSLNNLATEPDPEQTLVTLAIDPKNIKALCQFFIKNFNEVMKTEDGDETTPTNILFNLTRTKNETRFAFDTKEVQQEKIKLLYEVVKKMISGGDISSTILSTVFSNASTNTQVAKYVDKDGKVTTLPALKAGDAMLTQWPEIVDSLKKYDVDEYKFGKLFGTLINTADSYTGGLLGQANSVLGLVDECRSLGTEAQGDLYLSAKGTGTARLNSNRSLAASESANTDLDSIKAGLLCGLPDLSE